MSNLNQALEYAAQNREKLLQEYKEFLAIPSISTLPENRGDVYRAAQWLVSELTRLGMARVDLIETPLHPLVYAEWLGAPGKPTALIYGHYDVQPVDPLHEWHSDPFDPEIRGENIYARGASDMKGGLMAWLKAVEAVRSTGDLPINLKFILEGAEEIGSQHLPEFLENNRDLLKADFVINLDGQIHAPGKPSITYSLRGLAYFEIEVHGPKQDLHSGLFGGSILNPAQALCELIAGMHDADGRVTLPGFYDSVRPLNAEEREMLAHNPQTDAQWLEMCGAPGLWGEKGYTTVERTGARPTLEVNGIVGGFIGEGAKTVLPAKASAKISMRLVADQDAAAIKGQLEEYLRQNAPDTITWSLHEHSHGPSAIMDTHSPQMQATVKAMTDTFGVEPFFRRDGGSVPVVGMMQQTLGIDTIMIGFGLPDDCIHGPNEKQHLPTLLNGLNTCIRMIDYLGDI